MWLQIALFYSFLWLSNTPLWRRKWQPTPVFSRKSYGQRSLVGDSPWGCTESDITWWLNHQYSIVYIHHIFFIHSSVDGHLGCFHVLAIVNSAAMNTGVHVSFRNRVFVFSRYLPRSGIAGSYGNSTFSFLRNLSEDFFVDLSRV